MIFLLWCVSSVPEKQRVSMLWLEWVIQSGRMIPFQPRGSVACRPFPFALPLPGMSDIRCSSCHTLLQQQLLHTQWYFVSYPSQTCLYGLCFGSSATILSQGKLHCMHQLAPRMDNCIGMSSHDSHFRVLQPAKSCPGITMIQPV